MRISGQGLIAGAIASVAAPTLAIVQFAHISDSVWSKIGEQSINSPSDFVVAILSVSDIDFIATITLLMLIVYTLGVWLSGFSRLVRTAFSLWAHRSSKAQESDAKIKIRISTREGDFSVDLSEPRAVSDTLHEIERALKR